MKTNRYLMQLSYWLSTVAMIFFVLLVFFQSELQGHHLTVEEEDITKHLNVQAFSSVDNIHSRGSGSRLIVRKKINRNREGIQSTEDLRVGTLLSEVDSCYLEEILEAMSRDHFSSILLEEQPIPKKKEKPKTAFDGIIISASESHQVDADLIRAIIKAESNYNPKAVSRVGARGLMQLMPETAKYLGVKNSFDPEDNIHAGVRYFKKLLNQFGGDVKLALAAYNAGSRHVRNYKGIPPFNETRIYVQKVFKFYEFYQVEDVGFETKKDSQSSLAHL